MNAQKADTSHPFPIKRHVSCPWLLKEVNIWRKLLGSTVWRARKPTSQAFDKPPRFSSFLHNRQALKRLALQYFGAETNFLGQSSCLFYSMGCCQTSREIIEALILWELNLHPRPKQLHRYRACRKRLQNCFEHTGSELMVIWKGWFETVPCRATLATPFSALCPRILGTRFTNYCLRVSGHNLRKVRYM